MKISWIDEDFDWKGLLTQCSEAVVRRYSLKKVFLKFRKIH